MGIQKHNRQFHMGLNYGNRNRHCGILKLNADGNRCYPHAGCVSIVAATLVSGRALNCEQKI